VVVLRAGDTGPQVLLIRRGQPPKQGEWSIPGGRQEVGETVRETAAREVREETGVAIADLELIDVVDLVHRDDTGGISGHWTLVDFRARWTAGDVTADSDAADARWVALDALHGYDLWHETTRIIHAAAAMGDVP
jgi:ADP-ribose pyrophosphatase YjhB (NUDIX family)